MSRVFLVDTNVLSELMRSQPDQQVVRWFDMHIDAECYTSSITKAEIFLGIALLPEGIRRTRLTAIAEKSFSDDFVEPCLPFDDQSSLIYANVVSNRRRTGEKPLQRRSIIFLAELSRASGDRRQAVIRH